ncbi:MAG: serine hydrolase [Flavobacterium sp. BFFFF1]|uniref:serine hydrolase n=1 Tax=Flavobacterium sp. BFFFF1 TaxID=2015557 RepID=UPI000BC9B162|nr:serine hydrolase [Flavobacterium sp. BFFFF1]OYU80175.1 MAG: serine hydrolase [Flavobacterium sp. BFFFF1]
MKHRLLLFMLLISGTIFAQLTEPEVDALVNRTMATFNVPGIAVAVIKDGKVVLSKGYGVRSIITKEKVDANTLFGIASNSKAFTSAALAILIDEKKINWDDKVIQYIPEFKMYNDYVTSEFTVRDLLTHRSGLGLGAGDLMIWPDGHNFTPKDIINNIHFLKPVSGFRTKYDYDNLLYVIAGELVARVSGQSWNEFIEQRFLMPLGMTHSAPSWNRLKDTSNVIVPHVPIDGKLQVIKRYKNNIFDAAAGIYTSVNDLSKWVQMQLNNGNYNNIQFFSAKQQKEMWTPQTLIPVTTIPPYNTHLKAYGLGWFISDIAGHSQITHTGGLEGIVTQVTMIPDLKLGIIVLTNQQSGSAFNAITNAIKDSYLGIQQGDLVDIYSKKDKASEDVADKITDEVWATVAKNQKEKITVNAADYVGTYKDNWFGDIIITAKKGHLYFSSLRSPGLSGEMFFVKDHQFAVRWNNRFFHADAFVNFAEGNRNFEMRAISPLTDFSYDFQDLYFEKQ